MPNTVKGIVAYNKIRSELSKEVKDKGLTLDKGVFNELSRDIFRHNKGKQLSPVLSDIENQITTETSVDIGTFEMQDNLVNPFNYWEFNNNYIAESMHEDLWIISDFLEEPVKAQELDYYKHIRPLVSFIDKNRTKGKVPDPSFWFYGYAVVLKLTEPKFNPKTKKLESRLVVANIFSNFNDQQIPYELGMSGYYPPEALSKTLEDIEIGFVPEEEIKEPEKEEKAKERKERIELIEKETVLEKEKGVTAKEKRLLLETEERLLDKYTKLYEKGFLTKKQFQAKIAKL